MRLKQIDVPLFMLLHYCTLCYHKKNRQKNGAEARECLVEKIQINYNGWLAELFKLVQVYSKVMTDYRQIFLNGFCLVSFVAGSSRIIMQRHATLLLWWTEALRDDSNNGCKENYKCFFRYDKWIYKWVLNKNCQNTTKYTRVHVKN